MQWAPKCVNRQMMQAPAAMVICTALVCAALAMSPAFLQAQTQAQAGHEREAAQLVRQMVNNELRVAVEDQTHWAYLSNTLEADRHLTYEKIQTHEGSLKRLVAVNGERLAPELQQQEDARIRSFVADERVIVKKLQDERADAEKAKRMFQMFPDAFLYTLEGEEGSVARLSFKPNPDFDPPTREAQVFHAMSGHMWIDRQQLRMVRIQGMLTEEVKFGWGLLGHLSPGGTFTVEQKEVAPGHWQIAMMDVHMRGKLLFFKSLNIQEKEWCSKFERVPDTLTLAEAADRLRQRADTILAAK